jgi:RHH-type transcriptional regulator, rel operon repressor / antitoxin RelB
MTKALSVRVTDDLDLKLSEIARETERSKSFHVQKALEAYLSEIAELQVAYDRLHDTADPIIAIDDMRKELEL